MNEKAFKLSHDCDLYKKRMGEKEEHEKLRQMIIPFFEKYGLGSKYIPSGRLTVELSSERAKELKDSLMKGTEYGLYRFKVKSDLNKKWNDEVWSKIDSEKLHGTFGWAFGLIFSGRRSLWTWKGEVYGSLESDGDITLPDGATELKMSEYYRIIEEAEGETK